MKPVLSELAKGFFERPNSTVEQIKGEGGGGKSVAIAGNNMKKENIGGEVM